MGVNGHWWGRGTHKMDALGFVAHTPPDDDPRKWQSMTAHTGNVADLAADLAAGFASAFGAEELARWAAWLHDVGKYSDDFQKYLRQCNAAKHGGGRPPKPGSADHKVAGTRLALELLPTRVRAMIAVCVLGHCGGLNAFTKILDAIAATHDKAAVQEKATVQAGGDFLLLDGAQPMELPAAVGKTLLEREMFIRLLFSCLVDADGLDTERHSSPDRSALKQTRTLAKVGPDWLEKLMASQEALRAGADKTRVNEVRREVYQACRTAVKLPPGLFSLTVPTGGSKPRSSLAFALEHALEGGRSRLIYAIPYTSIIDQNAAEFRKILGEDAVLEHHSAMEDRTGRKEQKADAEKADAEKADAEKADAEKADAEEAAMQAEDGRDQQRKLDAENWKAPLIVTTVQLFESLFSNRTGRCREVHHIAGSVLILDEVQTLPAHLLLPLLDGLKTLIAHYGVTVVLCTPTQPAITGQTPFLQQLGPPRPIIPEDKMREHFQDLKRVTYHVETDPWDVVRGKMLGTPQLPVFSCGENLSKFFE